MSYLITALMLLRRNLPSTATPSSNLSIGIANTLTLLKIAGSVAQSIPLAGSVAQGVIEAITQIAIVIDDVNSNQEGLDQLIHRTATILISILHLIREDNNNNAALTNYLFTLLSTLEKVKESSIALSQAPFLARVKARATIKTRTAMLSTCLDDAFRLFNLQAHTYNASILKELRRFLIDRDGEVTGDIYTAVNMHQSLNSSERRGNASDSEPYFCRRAVCSVSNDQYEGEFMLLRSAEIKILHSIRSDHEHKALVKVSYAEARANRLIIKRYFKTPKSIFTLKLRALKSFSLMDNVEHLVGYSRPEADVPFYVAHGGRESDLDTAAALDLEDRLKFVVRAMTQTLVAIQSINMRALETYKYCYRPSYKSAYSLFVWSDGHIYHMDFVPLIDECREVRVDIRIKPLGPISETVDVLGLVPGGEVITRPISCIQEEEARELLTAYDALSSWAKLRDKAHQFDRKRVFYADQNVHPALVGTIRDSVFYPLHSEKTPHLSFRYSRAGKLRHAHLCNEADITPNEALQSYFHLDFRRPFANSDQINPDSEFFYDISESTTTLGQHHVHKLADGRIRHTIKNMQIEDDLTLALWISAIEQPWAWLHENALRVASTCDISATSICAVHGTSVRSNITLTAASRPIPSVLYFFELPAHVSTTVCHVNGYWALDPQGRHKSTNSVTFTDDRYVKVDMHLDGMVFSMDSFTLIWYAWLTNEELQLLQAKGLQPEEEMSETHLSDSGTCKSIYLVQPEPVLAIPC